MMYLRYFATEPQAPCGVCGAPMINHAFWGTPTPPFRPGVYFATKDGAWVCSSCCHTDDAPLWQRCLAELADDDVRNAPLLERCPCQELQSPLTMAEPDAWEDNSVMYHGLLGLCYKCDCGLAAHWRARFKLHWPDVYADLHARGKL